MSFAQNVIKELNKFRSNPKSIEHKCELVHKGLSRFKSNDPFLKEIESFIKTLESMKPLPELRYNEVLTEAAKKELPNFRGRANYKKCKKANSLKGIVPDYYLEAVPALVADDGADEPINVLTKVLLNREDKAKEGRAILCDPKFTQIGVAQEEFQEENMVILILATKFVENKPIKTTKNDFILNIQYHETKDIKKPKLEAFVHHRIKGDIFGGGNFEKTSFQKQVFTQGGNRPKLDTNVNPQPLRGNKSAAKITAKTKTAGASTGRSTTKTTTSTTTKTTTTRFSAGTSGNDSKNETSGSSVRQKFFKKRRF